MAWVAVGTAAGAIGASYLSSRSADKASQRATAAQDRALAFEQERYEDWQEVYGPIQTNLANYYRNVSPDYYAAIGLETFNKEYQQSMQQLQETFVQRGINPDSGIALSLEQQAELGAAEARAGIRRDAPRQAMEDQSRFLQVGLGQNPASAVSNQLSNVARARQESSLAASRAAGQAAQAAIGTIPGAVTGLSEYYRRVSTPETKPIPPIGTSYGPQGIP